MAGWFLQFQGSKFGPLSISEVKVVLSSGKLTGDLYAWKNGMRDWEAIDRLPELAGFMSKGRMKQGNEARQAARIPFMAAVKFSGAGVGGEIPKFTGICRDLSKGGMLVVSSSNPGFPGALVSLIVEPVSDSTLPRFTVEAVIVRLLPDKTGFSVRFPKLSQQQEDAITVCLRDAKSKGEKPPT